MSPKRIRVKIENPRSFQKPHCSLERARRYIRDSVAEWADQTCTALRMLAPKPALAADLVESRHAIDPFDRQNIHTAGAVDYERDLSGNFLRYPYHWQVSGNLNFERQFGTRLAMARERSAL